MNNSNTDVLQVTKENALQAYKNADSSGKSLLSSLFGKRHFISDICEMIRSWEDVCEINGIDATDTRFTDGEPDEIAYRKLKEIAKAYNQGWTPDWNNSSQYKYYPWFYLNSPGFRLGDFGCGWTSAGTGAGSRLCFSSEVTAEHAAKTFLEIYKDFIA